MPIVRLRPPLRELAGGRPEVRVDGATVVEALRDLERTHPKTAGWVLDDRGRIREHVAVFVEGKRITSDGPVALASRLEIVGAISGGSSS